MKIYSLSIEQQNVVNAALWWLANDRAEEEIR